MYDTCIHEGFLSENASYEENAVTYKHIQHVLMSTCVPQLTLASHDIFKAT